MKHESEVIGLAMSVYGQVGLTRNCLESIYSDPQRPHYQLSIVNNGSADETQSYLEEFAHKINNKDGQDRVILAQNSENQGLAIAWNQALRGLDTQWRVVVSNDVVVPQNWWQNLRSGMEQHKLDLAAPFILEGEMPNDLSIWTEAFRSKNAGKYWDEYSFVMFALHKNLLDEIGYLDENFKVGGLEDTDYIWRLRKSGKRYGLVGSTAVFHLVSKTMNEIRKKAGDGHFVTNLEYFREKWQKDPRIEENRWQLRWRKRWRRWKMQFGYM